MEDMTHTETWRDYERRDGSTASAQLKVWQGLYSPQLDNLRDSLVCLPPTYGASRKRYPVLYMHDGQNLFDATTSYAGEWRADKTLAALSREGTEAILVGVPHMGTERFDEYAPFYDPDYGGGRGDRYLDFITETLKPLIDRSFRTRVGREYTGLLGSSMGGLISLYGFFRHPGVFGFAGAMSPAFWFADGAMFPIVDAAPYVGGKIYIDVGDDEYPDDAQKTAMYLSGAVKMRRLLRDKGYSDERLRYRVEESGRHHESAWARRFPGALRFFIRG